jgi:hypothetical protein
LHDMSIAAVDILWHLSFVVRTLTKSKNQNKAIWEHKNIDRVFIQTWLVQYILIWEGSMNKKKKKAAKIEREGGLHISEWID